MLGSFAALILRSRTDVDHGCRRQHHVGTDTLFLVALGVVANDIGALFVGSAARQDAAARAGSAPTRPSRASSAATLLTLLVPCSSSALTDTQRHVEQHRRPAAARRRHRRHRPARRPDREHVQAQPRRQGLRQRSSRATAACSTASTASCSPCRRCTTCHCSALGLERRCRRRLLTTDHARSPIAGVVGVDRHADARRRPRRGAAATRSSRSASARRSTCSIEQANEFRPKVVAVADPGAAGRGRRRAAVRQVVDELATWSTTPTSWSTPSSASPACRSRWPRCAPASGWRWPTRRA